jgi:hypothetical protein
MPTNAGRSQQSANATATAPALAKQSKGLGPQSAPPDTVQPKAVGYGLPCAKCHLYYPADLDSCPTCHHKERVLPVMPKIPPRPVETAPDPVSDNALLEAEREEFLRQFKSQLVEAHANALSAPCRLDENHKGAPASAEVCGRCYERVQERLDVCEAALQIDVKEAAQIVYDAVWADASDPSKTYENAAAALLTELRKRAGISALLAPFQPLEH